MFFTVASDGRTGDGESRPLLSRVIEWHEQEVM